MTSLSRTVGPFRRWWIPGLIALVAGLGDRAALADPLYTITDLGTLPGYSSSVATAINNLGQVVGVDTTSANTSVSFLYSGGQLTQINPTGGLATAINDSGQVVGGWGASINDTGQTASANTYINSSGQIVPSLPGLLAPPNTLEPYAINNAGELVGATFVPVSGVAGDVNHPAIYANGQITDLFSMISVPANAEGTAIAINQKGDVLVSVSEPGSPLNVQWYLLDPSTRVATLLNVPLGSSPGNPVALNDKDQIVGGGMLYSNGSVQSLLSLLPQNSGWSNLGASAINDAGQIVGQGDYNGQYVAFLMTPQGIETPEPGPLALWGGITALIVASRTLRTRRRSISEVRP